MTENGLKMPKTAAWAASGSSCKQGVDGSNPSSGLTKGSGNGAFRVSGAGLERGPNTLLATSWQQPAQRAVIGMSILPCQTRTTPCSRSSSLQLESVGSRSVAIIAFTVRPSTSRSWR